MRKILVFAVLLLFPALCASETQSEPWLLKVAVIGDSITADGGYVRELSRLCPDLVFHNFGVSKESTAKILQRVRMNGTDLQNKICGLEDYGQIIVLMGVNNIDNPGQVINDMQKLFAMAKSVGSHPVRVIVLTLTPWKGYSTWTRKKQDNTDIVNGFILSYPENIDVAVDVYSPLGDVSDPDRLSQGYHNSNDVLHPRGVGQIIIGQTLYKKAFSPIYLASFFKSLGL